MTFQYEVRDPLGKVHQGTIDAVNREDAQQRLARDGFHVLSLDDDEGDGLSLFGPRIKRTEIIYVTNQLAVMLDTGIDLATALSSICEQEENPALKSLLLDLKSRVEAGDDLSHALESYPKQFDSTFVALVRSSEQTGSLAAALEQIAGYLQRDIETRGKVRGALAYPAVMLVLAIAVTIFLLTFVLPKFEPLFSRKGVELPKMTQAMMVTSTALIEYWYAWLLGVGAAVGGFLYARRTEAGRKWLDGVKLSVPILGPMFRKVAISRSIRTLGTMVRNGVTMLDALELSAQVAGNFHYAKVWREVRDEVTTGTRLCEALAECGMFPSTLVQMISSGEETGKLDQVLVKVSDYYDHEVETALKTATSLIEPIMIGVMGVVVGGIAMGLLLPIFSLSRGPT